MTGKSLPLPLGGLAPSGSRVRPWHQYGFRRGAAAGSYVVGVTLAIAGAWLGLTRASLSVSLDNVGYHVGDRVIRTVSAGDYTGYGALVIQRQGFVVHAALDGRTGDVPLQAVCMIVVGSGREQCVFVVGRQSFSSDDRLVGHAWRRRYSDGPMIDIRVSDPANPTPVPLPLGHD